MEVDSQKSELVMPEKLLNRGKIKNIGEARVLLNGYRLKMERMVEVVFKFELKMQALKENGKSVDLSMGMKNDVSKQQRIRLLWDLYQQLLLGNPQFFGGKDKLRRYTYDCGINFYSIDELQLSERESKQFELSFEKLSDASQAYLGSRVVKIFANLLRCENSKISLKDVAAREEGRDRSPIQFLEILSNQDLYKHDDYYMFALKMFQKRSSIPLQNDPRILKEGMQKNVRQIGDSIGSAFPIVQLDPKKSAFFPEMQVDQFLTEFLGARGDLERVIFAGKNLQMAAKQIKNLTVITTHLKERQRTFAMSGLTLKPADAIFFDYKGDEISVAKYFREVYAHRLKYPRLPCATEKCIVKGVKQENYHPLEVLEIVAGQRVPLDKQTPQMTEQMIRNCQAPPAKFRDRMKKQKDDAAINDDNRYFEEHGLRVERELLEAEACVLFPPSIVYNGNREEPDLNVFNWRMQTHCRYLLPATFKKNWVAVIVQSGVNPRDCKIFIEKIVQSAQSRGMQIEMPKRYEQFEETGLEAIREKFKYFKTNHCGFVMFFTRDKLDPVHHTFKLVEVESGITTQHVSNQTMMKALGPRGANMVIDNILLKTNLKLGGVNHELSTARINTQFDHDVVKKEWFAKSRMFLGIDVSHAAPQSLYDRQAGIPCGEPTVVGMAYTLGQPVKMMGTYWMQETRVAHIQDLEGALLVALRNYREEVGRFPKHLVVFRGGVSEGEFRIVLDRELSAFVNAFSELEQKESSFQIPALTIVIVQRASNYRVVPLQVNERARAADQNVRPGTCLDRGTMHPDLTEFLLVPHKAIQGTANPIRCTVIWDDGANRMPLEEIENVTNALCYAHGIVTSPVSVPAPLYAAADLAKRGRNNYKTYSAGGEALSEGAGAGDADPNYFGAVNDRLRPVIRTKFWA